MNFRLMQISDYDSIYNLWMNTPGMGLNSVDDSKDGIEKFLKRNPTTCFVAEEDGKIVGVIMAGNDGRRGYIYHTAVLPEFRGKHVAKTLVENAMAAAVGSFNNLMTSIPAISAACNVSFLCLNPK